MRLYRYVSQATIGTIDFTFLSRMPELDNVTFQFSAAVRRSR